MEREIVVREATERDWEARAALVRSAVTEYDFPAFIMFFFQELTLQVCVLCGAVLFIFVGAGVCASALVVPGAALALGGALALAHRALADAHAARLRTERSGFVAEARGPGGPALVGTVSVAECWGPRRSGWLWGLSVAPAWRRRGVGGALLAACRAYALQERLDSLEAATSQLQSAARSLMHSNGWELRGSYQRPVLGAALTLPMAQLGMELAT